jgi:hypothetical protein
VSLPSLLTDISRTYLTHWLPFSALFSDNLKVNQFHQQFFFNPSNSSHFTLTSETSQHHCVAQLY